MMSPMLSAITQDLPSGIEAMLSDRCESNPTSKAPTTGCRSLSIQESTLDARISKMQEEMLYIC
jgi:hypothetical protein